MSRQIPQEVTALLLKWRAGDRSALDQLMPLVYDELRRAARHCLRRERAGHTMQTTTLVHEAYLRLVDASRVPWNDRAHFFAIAAQLMRRVLIDEARKRHFQKRGGTLARIPLADSLIAAPERDVELMALDEALDRLARFAPRKSRVVELRFFGGLSIEQTAAVLDVSTDIVKREWRTAKLWLLRELSGGAGVSDESDAVAAH
ncbi:MAG TPA: sigma-70 family RNA polymerase sigma factor [Blastocatellia bacterium]|nr:sigma-70 family RNA polymerase sigma factor [Blastocatellia bacterium]